MEADYMKIYTYFSKVNSLDVCSNVFTWHDTDDLCALKPKNLLTSDPAE